MILNQPCETVLRWSGNCYPCWRWAVWACFIFLRTHNSPLKHVDTANVKIRLTFANSFGQPVTHSLFMPIYSSSVNLKQFLGLNLYSVLFLLPVACVSNISPSLMLLPLPQDSSACWCRGEPLLHPVVGIDRVVVLSQVDVVALCPPCLSW